MPVVGYLAYDHVAKLEPTVPLPADGPDAAGEPLRRRRDARPLRPRQRDGRGAAGDPDEIAAPAREELCVAETQAPVGARNHAADARPGHVRAEACERIKEHIRAGDAFQIVLSQRAERPTSASALELYRALRRVNPSPYLFLLELGDLALVGSSPETLVKCEGGRASLNPIAGTTHPARATPSGCSPRRRTAPST